MSAPTRAILPESRIHETALVHPGATLADDVTVGPFCIIGDEVELGPGCVLDSQVRLDGPMTIGARNRFFHGAAVGAIPQDLKFAGARSHVQIGEGNTFREFVTVNRATDEDGETVIGNENLFMAYVHVAHDCLIHDHVILANSVNLAGHVEVDEYAIVGGLTPVHQFVRIGRYSIVGGGSRLPKDMPPFFKAAGNPVRVVGPNSIGLERHGFAADVRRALKDSYRALYRSSLNVTQAVRHIRGQHAGVPEVEHLLAFVEVSNRGIVR